MKKIIGIDFGEARIGLSSSDSSRIMAFPLSCISCEKTQEKTVEKLLKEIAKESFDEFVIGLPLLMNGKDSPMSLKVRDFAKTLEETTHLKVHLWDERLTSKEIEKLLIESDMKRKKRSKFIDTLSATLILQNFLDAQKFSHENS